VKPDTGKVERLVLEISGPQITADKFTKGVSAFLGILKDVSRNVSGTPQGVRWVVTVQPGSVLVAYHPQVVKAPPAVVPEILDAVETGIQAVESGSASPKYWSDSSLRQAAQLGALVDLEKGELDRVRVWRDETPHAISPRAVSHVDALFGIESRDWGTIEGVLETLSGARDLMLVVRDPVTRRVTRCYFDDQMIEEVRLAWMRRVSVSGVIQYRRDGEPVSIEVEEFSIFPADEDLPDIGDIRGIFGGYA
jgi:hypothetical protein